MGCSKEQDTLDAADKLLPFIMLASYRKGLIHV